MQKKKRYEGPEEYPHDRLTVSVRKGYKELLQRAALEWNTDMSKLARTAIEDAFKARSHRMSEELKHEWERLKKLHGGGHWSEFL